MNKEKQIQISQKAFITLYLLIMDLDDYELEPDTRQRVQALEKAIESKFEAMARRQAYTEYKTAEPNTEDREAKRHKYLEMVGVHRDWISQKETLL